MSLSAVVRNALDAATLDPTSTGPDRTSTIITSAVFDHLSDPEVRKAVYEAAQEEWDDELGDLSMVQVHTILDALTDVLSELGYVGVGADGQ